MMLTETSRRVRMIVGAALGLLAVVPLVVTSWGETSVNRSGLTAWSTAGEADQSFVFRFDGDAEAFEVFTIPTSGAGARDIGAAVNATNVDVWFTEAGADRIGRLVYTATHDFAFHEYPLADGSRPLNLAVDEDDYVWFTAAGGDYVGRLDWATGQTETFGVAAGSYPADLDLAPDGSVWFTQMMADRIAQLVVTSTTDYALSEYTHASLSGGRPYGIVVVRTGPYQGVYLTQTLNDRVTRFNLPNTWMHIHSLTFPDIPDEPYALVDNHGEVWGVERAGNRVSNFRYSTWPVVNPYALSPPASLPTDIAVDLDSNLWFTQWAAGQIGRLVPTVPPEKSYYPLPLPDVAPTGITVDSQGIVWVVASHPYCTYLPLVMRGEG